MKSPRQLRVVTDSFDVDQVTGTDLVLAGISLLVGLVLAQFVRRAVRRLVAGPSDLVGPGADLAGRLAGYSVMLLALVIAFEFVGLTLGPVLTVLVIIGLVRVSRAAPLVPESGSGDHPAGRAPFQQGDQIESDEICGTVGEVNSRTVIVDTPDGRRVHLPNRQVLDREIVNLTVRGRRRTTLEVGVEYDTDLGDARQVILGAITGLDEVLDDPESVAEVYEFGDNAITIRVLFWHAPTLWEERAARDAAARSIKRALDSAGIVIAFPQRVLWRATGRLKSRLPGTGRSS